MRHAAGFKVLTQQVDLDGPAVRMSADVLLGLAGIELEYRRDRQQAGISLAKKRVYKGPWERGDEV